MIWNCANPNCAVAFIHRQGRLFRFPKRPIEGSRAANTHSVQHFWLCADCSKENSLEYDEALGVVLIHHPDRAPAPEPRQLIAAA